MVEECAAWLRTLLAIGPVPSAELEQRCLAHGWSRSTYERARQTAGVRSEKDSRFQGAWVSFLASAQPTLFPPDETLP
jgi:hypothetical protein